MRRSESPDRRGALRTATLSAALSVASLGCVESPLLVCPRNGGTPWTELDTPHFVVRTDLAAEPARAMAADFEELHAALGQLTNRPAQGSQDKVDVVVFASSAEFDAFNKPSQLRAAYAADHLLLDLEPTPTLVMYRDEDDEQSRGVFLHELTHRFLHERFADLPMWLDEGFARYYETFHLEGRRGVLGAPWRRQAAAVLWSDWYATPGGGAIPVSSIPPLEELVSADRDKFYAEANFGPVKSRKMHANYAGAFRFVHMLANGPNVDYRKRFFGYLQALERGTKPARALYDAFTGVDPAALGADYRAYVASERIPVREIDLGPPSPPPPVSVRAMSDAEVHILWARLYPSEEETLRYVQGELDLGLQHDPGSIEIRLRRALAHAAEKHFREAESDLAAALAARPNDPRTLLARLRVYGAINAPAYRCGEREPAVDATIERLARVAVTGTELSVVATYYELHGEPALGLPFAAEAIRRAPLCWSCQDTYSLLLLQTGDLRGARAANDRALALLPERSEDPRVGRHRVMLAALGDAPQAPSFQRAAKDPKKPPCSPEDPEF